MFFACLDRLVAPNVGRAEEKRRVQLGRRLQELDDERAVEENVRAAEWTWEPWLFLGWPRHCELDDQDEKDEKDQEQEDEEGR